MAVVSRMDCSDEVAVGEALLQRMPMTGIAAGQFFTTLWREVQVVENFDDTRAQEWFCAMDSGFAHYTVVLLGCTEGDGNLSVVDEQTRSENWEREP